MLFNKNDKIGAYVVKFPHTQSDYAETYRVKDAAGRTCFLKLINLSKLNRHQIDNDGKILEIEISRKLKHPNLCEFVESGSLIKNGGQYEYFVTEYVSGETLDKKISRSGPLSVYEIKKIGNSLLSALDFLHTRPEPVIHGEITIQNILISLVDGPERLKIIDFGHARYLSKTYKPNLKQINPFYLAPECFSGVYQAQSDLYAVGVVLYFLVYNELPWFFDTSRVDGDIVDAILEEKGRGLKLPSLDLYDLDDGLINTIIKSLSFDVADRFQTAVEFMAALNGDVSVDCQSTKRQNTNSWNSSSVKKETVNKPKGKGFAAIAGMDELKQKMREDVIEPLHNPEEFKKYGITIPNGMLLYGPPGCGKTFFAKHFAEEVGVNYMFFTAAGLKSKWVNATQENIAKMFKEAEENAPTVIYIDEFNELVPNRDSDVHEMARSAVNEMLAQMDRTGEKGVFVIGATNYPHMIDPAILRAGRLDRKYYVGVPDMSARAALFKLYLDKRPCDLGLDYDELARLTENYVSSDIQLIVNDASRDALKKQCKISFDLLKNAISETLPSISAEELKKYEGIRAFMNGIKYKNDRRPVGF